MDKLEKINNILFNQIHKQLPVTKDRPDNSFNIV